MNHLQTEQLKCEYMENPLGMDVMKPRISWKIRSVQRGVMQGSYHIQVSLSKDDFETLIWDTGKVTSDQSLHVEYEGEPLTSRTRYYYRVRIWDQSNQASNWSDTAFWETGMLNTNEWNAEWITPDTSIVDPQSEQIFLMRKAFEVRKEISRARIYATSLGLYELELNGKRVGDQLFTPGWTSYDHRLQYQTYDVTDMLVEGGNAIGLSLANGWYKGNLGWNDEFNIYGDKRAGLLQMHILYKNGSEDVITTNNTWKSSTGPIRMSELYHGELYDARLEQLNWSCGDFDDLQWYDVEILQHSKEILIAQENEATRIIDEIKPIELILTPAGETVLDMGQNMIGWIEFTVQAEMGASVVLHHAEVLDKEGNFYTGNLRSAKQRVEYICKGTEIEQYEPQFTFQGFRYVKVEGLPEPLDLKQFTGKVIHTDMDQTGSFDCSHPLINQLQQNIVWGQKGNFLDIPTDCPQRDERLGWTGDAQVFVRTAAYNYNVAPFFTKWLRDLSADQYDNGGVPFVVPDVPAPGGHSSAAWGDAAVICPWNLYLCYGDKRILEQQYDSMKAWIEYIRNEGDNEYLWNTGFHFGDWLGLDAKENSYVGATPKDLIATAFFAHSTSLVKKTAEVLGCSEDVDTYGVLLDRIIEHFNKEFITPNGRLASPTQTAHVLTLMFDIVDEPIRKRLAQMLAENVEENKFHLTTGFVGTPYLCHVLSSHGYHDIAVKLIHQESYPSWLYPITKGATTIWEHWDGIKPDGSFWSDDMNSYNHYAYGAIGDWLYRVVAGLDMNETQPGYKDIVIKPNTDSGLEYAAATYQSMYGEIRSAWSKDANGNVQVNVTIPPNTTASAVLPFSSIKTILESGKPLSQVDGILQSENAEHGVIIKLGSGEYSFSE